MLVPVKARMRRGPVLLPLLGSLCFRNCIDVVYQFCRDWLVGAAMGASMQGCVLFSIGRCGHAYQLSIAPTDDQAAIGWMNC